jgi:hypothetical protein
MRKLRRVVSIATLFMMFVGRVFADTPPQLININLISRGMTGAAAVGQAGDFWNESPVGSLQEYNDMMGIDPNTTPFELLDSTGAPGSVFITSFSFDTNNLGHSAFAYGSGAQLMEGCVLGTGSMTLTGLGAGSSYVLYVYSQATNNNPADPVDITANGVTFATSANSGTGTTFIKGTNYASQLVTADGTGTLTVSFNPTDVNGSYQRLSD